MVVERVTDGRRIAELLASELDGRSDGGLDRVRVVDADPDAEASPGGTFAYAIAVDRERVAEVYVHPERARIEFVAGFEDALDAAREAGLRTRSPSAVRTPVLVESGAEVKRAVPVVRAAVDGAA